MIMVHPATNATSYRGRFAPSPTGPLHLGSLIAALGSYLDARSHGGEWLLRMEDVDSPRCLANADTDILKTLEVFGFEWNGEVVYQSRRVDLYHAAFAQLKALGHIFPCACTRKHLAGSSLAIDGGQLYDGRCRAGMPPGVAARSWRVRVPDEGVITFDDAIQECVSQQLRRDVGDFVVLRADGLFAYQLAVVVDDAEQGVTHIVRGGDLLASTPRQIYLQQLLGYRNPLYAHLPVAVDAKGEKLSKQTMATALDASRPMNALLSAWHFLGQSWDHGSAPDNIQDFWDAATKRWQLAHVPRTDKQSVTPYAMPYSRSSLPP